MANWIIKSWDEVYFEDKDTGIELDAEQMRELLNKIQEVVNVARKFDKERDIGYASDIHFALAELDEYLSSVASR